VALEAAAIRDDLLKPIYLYAQITFRSFTFAADYSLNPGLNESPIVEDGQASPVFGALYAITARK